MSDQRKSKSFMDVMLTPLRVFDQRKSKSLVNVMLTPLHSMLKHGSTRGATSESSLHVGNILDVFSGCWSKASKCKKLLRLVQRRLKLLKDRRFSNLNQSRYDTAQLLRCSEHQIANKRAEQIYKDKSMLEVYDLLEAFCEVIILNIPYIKKHRDCPNDIKEAASTLVFASARCGELPELRKLRNLFRERYGQEFNMVALDLLPGNLVNITVKENLLRRSVPNDAKYTILNEIASSLQLEPLPLENTFERQQQLEIPDNNSLTNLQGSQRNDSKIIPEIGIPVRHSGDKESDVLASKVRKNEGNESSYSLNYPKKPFPIKNYRELGLFKDYTSKETVYLSDDVKEFEYSICKDGSSIQDQRIFYFELPNVPPKRISYYLRATSMPSERPKNNQSDSIIRSNSFPFEHSTNHWSNAPRSLIARSPHVHPKLPEYDDIAEQFMSIKKASSYLRATSMPSERPKNNQSDSIIRSNSFPFEHSTNHWSNAPRSPHVHPKLPEYDDIAEQFMAIKKAALLKKCEEGRSVSKANCCKSHND